MKTLLISLGRNSLFLLLLLSSGKLIADELFDSHDVLDIVIEAPFTKIHWETDKAESYPGKLEATGVEYDVELNVRGNKRLDKDTCRYPPLWVNFKKKKIKDTLFEHQKKVKLVVLCSRGKEYYHYLRSEYLIYRLYNLVTPLSFRVRWLNITYINDKGRSWNEPGFFIERKSRLAKRVGMETTDVEEIKVSELRHDVAAMVALFQFIVANADYSVVKGHGGTCCHNAKLLMDETGEYVPVIYDFDFSGAINASYALPPAGLRIRNVITRLYRGFCRHNARLADARSRLLSLQDDMSTLIVNDSILTKRRARGMHKYLMKSLDYLRDDDRYAKHVMESCR